MEPCPALILAQIRRMTYTAQRTRTLIDPETLRRIIDGEGRA